MSEPGTLQTTILLVADALAPLGGAFAPDRAAATLAELGIVTTPAQAGAVASAAQPAAAAATALTEDAAALVQALVDDDTAEVVTRTFSAIERIATVVDGIDDLQSAVAGLGVPPAVAGAFAERLFNFLLVRSLDRGTGVNEILELLGILARQRVNEGSTDPALPPHVISTFDFSVLGPWITDPVGVLSARYGWGTVGFDGIDLLRRLGAVLERFGVPGVLDDTGPTPMLDFAVIAIRPRTDLTPRGLGADLRQSLPRRTLDLGVEDLTVELETQADLPFGLELTFQPASGVGITLPGGSPGLSGAVTLRVLADRTAAVEKFLIFGEGDASRLEFGRLGLEATLRFDGTAAIPSLRFDAGGGKVRISLADADGFIATILKGVELESDFDLAAGIRAEGGVYFEGSSTLEVQLASHLDLGPVEISAFTVSVGIDGATFPVGLAADLTAVLGPLVAVVQQVGVRAVFELTENRDGNAGPVDVGLEFKPPIGVGLAIDAGPVRGGGFLRIDAERGEYAGVLQLSLLDVVSVTAIGVITTKFPDGSTGFSFLAVISVEFNPGIQLGFGFTLIGVGGLVGLNRSVDLDALAAGARSGSIDTILFPQDVVANATRIISDLRVFFPPAQGVFLIGPMVKLGWGTPTLISLSLGVIIEIPGNVAIVGKLTVAIPDVKAALIIIQVAFIGAIEFDTKRVWFTAVLYDSRIIYMPLEGGMGVLAAFGDDPNFVVTVGGFHPAYNPPALPFPDVPRIAINILNTPVAKVIVTAYFAVTSNTVQFGAAAEVYFGVGIANIQGHLGFDALFQFSPFYFVITVSASLSVKLFGAGLFSVRFRGTLEGTSPWHIEGTGSISLLFWDVDVDFSTTWGDKEDTELPPISVLPIVEAEFQKAENWTAKLENSNTLLVSLRPLSPEADLVLHPLGSLSITQRAVPLGITLDKLGSQRPDDADLFHIAAATTGLQRRAEIMESFATAQFKELSDDQKLSAADFEKEEAGIELAAGGSQTKTSFMTKRVVRYEQIIIDTVFRRFVLVIGTLVSGLFHHFLAGNAVARASVSVRTRDRLHLFDEKIVVAPTAYVVASTATNAPFAGAPFVGFASRAAAQEYLATQIKADPAVAARAHILRGHEVQVAA
ncbi:DUF6603 domain-containing protein [Streptomyces sp. NPDC054854]